MRFDQHSWGTVLAVGAGLAYFNDTQRSKQLSVQLDECQVEWEATVVAQIVDFVRLIVPRKPQAESTPVVSREPSTADEDSWASVNTSPSSEEVTASPLILQISAKKWVTGALAIRLFCCRVDAYFTARQSAFIALSVGDFRLMTDAVHPSDSLSFVINNVHVGVGEFSNLPKVPGGWWEKKKAEKHAMTAVSEVAVRRSIA